MITKDIRNVDWRLGKYWSPGTGSLLAVLASAVALVLFSFAADRPTVILYLPAVALLVWISRRFGALAILALLVAFPEMRVPGIPFDVPILIPVILFLFGLETLRRGRWRTAGAGAAFVIFVAAMAISWIWAEATGQLSLIQLDEFSSSNIHLSRIRVIWQIGAWIIGFGIFLFTVNHIRTIADLYSLTKYLIIIGVLVAAYGYYELLASTFGLPYYFPSIHNIDFVPNAKISFGNTVFPRIYSTFGEPKVLGRFLLIPLFLSASVWSVLNTKRYLYYSIFLLGAIILTFSTTAWLGAISGLFVWTYFLQPQGRRRVWKIIGGSAIVVIVLWAVSGTFVQSIVTDGITFLTLHPARIIGLINNPYVVSVDYVNGWTLGWTLFTSSPVFGVGIGNSPFFSGITDYVFTPFNLFLLLLAETGLVGLAAFMIMLGIILVKAIRAIRIRRNLAERPLAVAIIAGALAAFGGGIFTYMAFGGARFYMEDWVLLALMARGAQLMSRQPTEEATA